MAEHDWKQLLEDPEVRETVEMVARTTRRAGDPYIDDDRISYLWDRAVDIAIKYEMNTEARDPIKYWYAYLYSALRREARHQILNVYAPGLSGDEMTERIHMHTQRASVEELFESGGDLPFVTHIHNGRSIASNPEDVSALDIAHPDAPGRRPLSRQDPLYRVLLLERLERDIHAAEAREYVVTARTGVQITGTGLCSDVSCWLPSIARGLCTRHYQAWRSNWGTVLCTAPDCVRPSVARKLCGTHYAAMKREDPDAPRCLDCDRAAISKGRCGGHAEKARRQLAS